jgi:hypothetical protein
VILIFLAVCLIDVIGVGVSWRGLIQPVPSALVVMPHGQ